MLTSELMGKLLIWAMIAIPGLSGAAASRKPHETQTGLASFYDDDFRGARTASRERYQPENLVAAHPAYPAGTIVQVTNLQNGRSVTVRIIDRGPSPQNRREGVIIDLSRRAAEILRFTGKGRTRVRTRVIRWGGAPGLR